jgi:hypothetical protein
MNRLPLFCGLLFLAFFEPTGMKAQPPLRVNVVQDLSFGSFVVSVSGGTITITPEGTRTTTGTIVPLSISTEAPAIFEVSKPGSSQKQVNIVFPASAYLTRSGGSERIVVNNFKSDKPSDSFLVSNVTQRVNVGATLTVQGLSTNPPGNYAGTFSVTFAYE